MTERNHQGFRKRPPRGVVLVLAALAGAIACSGRVSANDADHQQIKSSIQFSLQCNATFGTIQDIELSSVAASQDGLVTVRGTYKQKVGSFSRFGFQAPDATGGVFEGIYQRDRKAFKELQFKISIRSGTVPSTCLR